jgi:hypothetical protein
MGLEDVPTRGPSFDSSSGTSSRTSGFLFFFWLLFFFSFLSKKKRKKETKRFEIKEELKLKKNWFLGFITTSLSTYKIEIKKKFSLLD